MENSFKDQQTVVEKVENTDRTEESIPQTSKHVEVRLKPSYFWTMIF